MGDSSQAATLALSLWLISHVGPVILKYLFQTCRLPLYGSALWSLSSPALHHIEVVYEVLISDLHTSNVHHINLPC